MRRVLLSASAAILFVAVIVHAGGQNGSPAAATDPRVGLKPGLTNAGVAIRNMELEASLPKPKGFFDPAAPLGDPTEPEEKDKDKDKEKENEAKDAAKPPAPPSGLDFANSDIAFSNDRLFVGNFNGFNIYDIHDPKKPQLLTSVVCPGGQGDLSVRGNLLVMSVEQTRGRIDCGTEGVQPAVSAERFRGVRIFDISDVRKPLQVAAVQTCRGSHTHTLVSSPNDKDNLYIYGSGTGTVRSTEELAGCSGLDPKEDPNTALFSIDVIQVPLASPKNARIVGRPRIFADEKTGAVSGLWPGGDHGPGTQKTSLTNQCHDITVFPEIGLAAGACAGNGILLDISDPVKPVRLDAVSDKNFAYWHSATFNNDGTKVIFTDEWGGGTRPRCRATDSPTWGADAIFDVVDRKLKFGGYYKMPAPQTEQENCVAHNGSLVPVPGRDIMVQGWYQGGVSVFDFTDSAHPVEIAFFDRGPVDASRLFTAGFWSGYWYNGHIYGTEIARGIDVFRLTPSEFLTQNEIDAANLVKLGEFNVQNQSRVTWPAASAVARALVDQLTRSHALQADRAQAVNAALALADKVKSNRDKDADAARTQLSAVASQLDADAKAASGRDANRLRSLSETMKGRSAALH